MSDGNIGGRDRWDVGTSCLGPVLMAQGRRPGQAWEEGTAPAREEGTAFYCHHDMLTPYVSFGSVPVCSSENNCAQNRRVFHWLKTEKDRNRFNLMFQNG